MRRLSQCGFSRLAAVLPQHMSTRVCPCLSASAYCQGLPLVLSQTHDNEQFAVRRHHRSGRGRRTRAAARRCRHCRRRRTQTRSGPQTRGTPWGIPASPASRACRRGCPAACGGSTDSAEDRFHDPGSACAAAHALAAAGDAAKQRRWHADGAARAVLHAGSRAGSRARYRSRNARHRADACVSDGSGRGCGGEWHTTRTGRPCELRAGEQL